MCFGAEKHRVSSPGLTVHFSADTLPANFQQSKSNRFQLQANNPKPLFFQYFLTWICFFSYKKKKKKKKGKPSIEGKLDYITHLKSHI